LYNSETCGYSSINIARSALSLVIIIPGSTFGEHPDVCKYLKGIKNLKPPKVKYDLIWDPDVVLATLKKMAPAHEISLYELTIKTIMLIMLATGRRPQIILALNLEFMKRSKGHIRFGINPKDLKEGRFNVKGDIITFGHFPDDRALCVYTYLSTYLDRTENIRKEGTSSVFVTCSEPHDTPHMDTVKHWIKESLTRSGIDTSVYGAGSTRAAATSKAKKAGCSIKTILASAGWKRSSTFGRFYNKKFIKLRKDTLAHKVLSVKK
jgi:hypothetical protein